MCCTWMPPEGLRAVRTYTLRKNLFSDRTYDFPPMGKGALPHIRGFLHFLGADQIDEFSSDEAVKTAFSDF